MIVVDQLGFLLEPPRARRTDPPASQIAAASFKPGGHHARILEALARLGTRGGTHREIGHETGLTPEQVDRRLVELRRFIPGAQPLVVRLAAMRGDPPAHVHVLARFA